MALKTINIRSFLLAFLPNNSEHQHATAPRPDRLEAPRVNSRWESRRGEGGGGGRAHANLHPATREMSWRCNLRADSSGSYPRRDRIRGKETLRWLSAGPSRAPVCFLSGGFDPETFSC